MTGVAAGNFAMALADHVGSVMRGRNGFGMAVSGVVVGERSDTALQIGEPPDRAQRTPIVPSGKGNR